MGVTIATLGLNLKSLTFIPTLFFQDAGRREPRRRRGAEAEDRAAAEGEEESAAGQQHDTPAALLQVRLFRRRGNQNQG